MSIGTSTRQIQEWLGVPQSQSQRLLRKARNRGYRPEVDKTILQSYLEDGIKTGRRKEISIEAEAAILLSANEKSSRVIAREHGISATSVQRIIRENNVHGENSNRKPSAAKGSPSDRSRLQQRR